MTRVHELVLVPGHKSRLTITPSRVTVKVGQDARDMTALLQEASRGIAERISEDSPSLRGCFDLKGARITLRSNSGDRKATFTFGGEYAPS